MEKLLDAENEEIQRQILDRFAQDLPITNRTVKGGMVQNVYTILEIFVKFYEKSLK